MKLALKISSLLLTVSFLFTSCQPDDPSPNNDNNGTLPGQYTVRGKVDGSMKSSTGYLGFYEDEVFLVGGDDGSNFAWYIGFTEDIPLGQPVPFDEWQEVATLTYVEMPYNEEELTPYSATAGTLTLNLIDTVNNLLKGTFEGTVSNGTNTKQVTEGYFYAPYIE